MNSTSERLSALREWMRREHLSAFIFPSTDPHQSEYVPDRWKGREWISGFTGSAGTAVVTLQSAALWTDSRYFLQAEEQLANTEFQLMRMGVEDTPTLTEWLGSELASTNSPEVGVDGQVVSMATAEQWVSELRSQGGITLRTSQDPLQLLWLDRPSVPTAPVRLHPLEWAGEESRSKLQRLRKLLRQLHADGMMVSALDEVAWLTNLRGEDVHCNPVFLAHLLVDSQTATLFIDPTKLSENVRTTLTAQGIEVAAYTEAAQGLANFSEYALLLDPNTTNSALAAAVRAPKLIRHASPVAMMKAVKNSAEQEGFRRAMVRDGVAMVQFLKWLEEAVPQGHVTELTVDEKLTALRAAQPHFRSLSFDTIAGYGAHGAIVHYEATPESAASLRPEGLLLLDSGAHYDDGTTDITRTIALGPLTAEQCHIYTQVLRAHIQLELARFPEGTTGTQIDALAREPLWREGLNYLHGTGHGVGACLNVHEGPHQIRMNHVPAPLCAGMTVTDEPGLYLAGKFGVRIENVLLVRPAMETPFGCFLEMEALTLCPIDRRPILVEALLPEEVEWLNAYHERVYQQLSPHLDAAHQEWLAEACQPLVAH